MPAFAPQFRVGAVALTSLALALLAGCGGGEVFDAGFVADRPGAYVPHDAGAPTDVVNQSLTPTCMFRPDTPGCPQFCMFHPDDEHCTQAGSQRCTFRPDTPGCPQFCMFHPDDEHCTQAGSLRCMFHPDTPGCPQFCMFHPLDVHCTH